MSALYTHLLSFAFAVLFLLLPSPSEASRVVPTKKAKGLCRLLFWRAQNQQFQFSSPENTLDQDLQSLFQRLQQNRRMVVHREEWQELLRAHPESSFDELTRLIISPRRDGTSFPIRALALEKTTRNLILGRDLELPGKVIHAEEFILAQALLRGTQIRHLITASPPCESCLEWLFELGNAEKLELTMATQRGPLFKLFAPPIRPYRGTLLSTARSRALLPVTDRASQPTDLFSTAAHIASFSYVPWTSPAGVVIRLKNQKLVVGAAMITSDGLQTLSPFDVALVELIARQYSIADIESVTLVETEDSLDSQRDSVKKLLAILQPQAQFSFGYLR